MLNISRLVIVALLTVGASNVVLPHIATADSCTRISPTNCPPDTNPDPDPDTDPDPGTDPDPDPGPDPGPGPDPDPGTNPDPHDNEPYPEPEDAKDPDPDQTEVLGDLAVACRLKDEEPITNDLWIVNVGTALLPEGTKIRWRIPATGEHGAFLLPRDVPVGEERVLRDFLADVEVGSECRIQIIA